MTLVSLEIGILKDKEILRNRIQLISSYSSTNFSFSNISDIESKKNYEIDRLWEEIKFSHTDYVTLSSTFGMKSSLKGLKLKKIYGDKPKQLFIKTSKIFNPKLKELRIRLALMEILTFFHPNHCIPKIIELSLYYLKDDFIINWLSKINNNEQSTRNFISIFDIDKRTISKRKEWNPYLSYFKYYEIEEIIKECRKEKKSCPFLNSSYFSWRTYQSVEQDNNNKSTLISDEKEDFNNFINEFEARILNEKSFSHLIVDIMIKGEVITDSYDAFIKSKTSIKKKLEGYTSNQIEYLKPKLSINPQKIKSYWKTITILEKIK